MITFEVILVMLTAAVLLLGLARRLKLPYPVLLAIAGAGLAFAPVHVGFHLAPELVLALFVAPVLLDAAYDTSLRDLKRHWVPVASLVLIVVGQPIDALSGKPRLQLEKFAINGAKRLLQLGTFETSTDVRYTAALGGNPDNGPTSLQGRV
jgi:hypothetical protein